MRRAWARFTESFRAWWQNPQLNVWVLAVFAVLLVLRKPHALHTPQLWAEDGSIFVMVRVACLRSGMVAGVL
jgi:hypothetical protein